jgi:hypothetical protein
LQDLFSTCTILSHHWPHLVVSFYCYFFFFFFFSAEPAAWRQRAFILTFSEALQYPYAFGFLVAFTAKDYSCLILERDGGGDG